MPLVVVLAAAAVAAIVTALVVWRFPAHDPAAPRVKTARLAEVARVRPVASFLRRRTNPEEVTGLLLTGALVLILGAVVALGALAIAASHHTLLADYDLSASRWGADHATSMSTRWLREISMFGGTPVMIGAALAVGIVEYIRTRRRSVFWFLTAVVLGQVILMNGTKWIVDRPRPDIARLTGFSGSSFPSGHAAAAAATFAAVAFLCGRGRSQNVKVMLAAGAVAIAVAVAATRVLLGVHWFTDVVAGLALGWGWFAMCSIAFGGRILHFGEPVAVAEDLVSDPPPRRGASPTI